MRFSALPVARRNDAVAMAKRKARGFAREVRVQNVQSFIYTLHCCRVFSLSIHVSILTVLKYKA